MNTDTSKQSFTALILTDLSQELDKSNGGKYALCSAEITDDSALKGMIVTASRTLINKDKEEKRKVEKGEEVTLWLNVDEREDGSKKPFFEIQSGPITSTDEEILSVLAKAQIE